MSKTIDKIMEEKVICRLLLGDRTSKINFQIHKLLNEYQTKYNHAFPISSIDKYLGYNDECQNDNTRHT